MADKEKVLQGLKCCNEDPNGDDCGWYDGDNPECPYNTNTDGCIARLMRDAYDILKDQPDVVRCKDCKFWYKDECSHLCKITGDLHPANWFFADGEHK